MKINIYMNNPRKRRLSPLLLKNLFGILILEKKLVRPNVFVVKPLILHKCFLIADIL